MEPCWKLLYEYSIFVIAFKLKIIQYLPIKYNSLATTYVMNFRVFLLHKCQQIEDLRIFTCNLNLIVYNVFLSKFAYCFYGFKKFANTQISLNGYGGIIGFKHQIFYIPWQYRRKYFFSRNLRCINDILWKLL